jgi:quercetin dioxygenase-like cupin family protein
MTISSRLISLAGAVLIATSLGVAGAQSPQEAMVVDAAKADFKEVVPGVKKKVLWGNHDTGPYVAFTKFDPGLANPLHTHTSEVRIVVLRGAYLYTPQGGKQRRIGPGSYISVPGGLPHVSAADAKAGALFYEESPGGFDLKPVEQPGKK